MLRDIQSHPNVLRVQDIREDIVLIGRYTVIATLPNGGLVDSFLDRASETGDYIPEVLTWMMLTQAADALMHSARSGWLRVIPRWYFHFEDGIQDQARLRICLADFDLTDNSQNADSSRQIGFFLYDIINRLPQPPGTNAYSPLLRQCMDQLTDLSSPSEPIDQVYRDLVQATTQALQGASRELPDWAVQYFKDLDAERRQIARTAFIIEEEFRTYHGSYEERATTKDEGNANVERREAGQGVYLDEPTTSSENAFIENSDNMEVDDEQQRSPLASRQGSPLPGDIHALVF